MSMEDYGFNEPRYSDKSYIVTLLLVYFLGSLGVHRFYTGKTGTGVAMLVMTLTGVLSGISGIWAFVDLLTIIFNKFPDAEGNELAKYNPGCAIMAGIGIILTIILSIIVIFETVIHQ